MGRGGQAAPRRDRPPGPAGSQRDGRRRRPDLADRFQLLGPDRDPAPEGHRPGRAHGVTGHPGRRGQGGIRRHGGHRRPGGRGRGAAAAAPGPVGRHPPLDRTARGPAGENPVGGSRGRWLRGPATGPHPAGTAPHLGDDSRPRGRLLLPPSATGPGEQQLARHPVGALGVAACRDRHVGADLPGWRGLLAGRRAGTGAVLAHGPGPSGLFLHQPGLPGQRRRHGTERPLPAEIRGRPGRGRRGGRAQRARRGYRPRDPARHFLRLGQPQPGPCVQAAPGQQAVADPRRRRRPDRDRASHPARPALRNDPAAEGPAVGLSAACGR